MTMHPEAGVERPYGDPPELDAKPDWKVAFSRARSKFSEDQCTDLAASLTYYSVQAIFPAIIAAVSTIGVFGNGPSTTNKLIDTLAQIAGKKRSDIPHGFTDFINNLQNGGKAGLALALGILLSLWSASGYVGAFSRMQNRIYDVAEGRPVWKLRPWLYMITIIVFVFGILSALALVASGPVASQIFGSTGATVWDWVKLPFIAAVVMIIISLIYWGAPNVKRPLKEALFNPGAVLAFVIWAVGSVLFAWYVTNMGNYGKTYGPMATPIILLLWLWITNLAMLFGAEFDSELLRTRQLKTGYPAEELILLPVRDGAGILKKAEKYDALIERAHALRETSGVPDSAVGSMYPVEPGTRSSERTAATISGSSEKRPVSPQGRTVERNPSAAMETQDPAPKLASSSLNSRTSESIHHTDGATAAPVAEATAKQRARARRQDVAERERAEIAADRAERRKKAIVEGEQKRAIRRRMEREEARLKKQQADAEAKRKKEEAQREKERPLEDKWAEVEHVRARYDHGDTREFRAVEAERAERRRQWFRAHPPKSATKSVGTSGYAAGAHPADER